MLLLTIETSCDETAAAIVRDGRTVLSSVVSTQIATHAEYGGVVPEIASRKHLETISLVVQETLKSAGMEFTDIEGVAVTQGPGLAGALLVGIATAKAIAWACRVPLVGVNHIESHLLAPFLEGPVEFPFLALAVSGGHTHLYQVDGIGRYRTLGQTLDDAAGEAFDKVAKLVGLPYPGGVAIDRLAAKGDPAAVPLPRPLLHDGGFNFSFSGLKTAVLNRLQKHPDDREGTALENLCASFQAAVCDVLVCKTAAALESTGLRRLVVAGGVACNSRLRSEMNSLSSRMGVELHIPSPSLCADNAAMLGVAGDYYLVNGVTSGFELDALPVWPLDAISERLDIRGV
ncbi:tRNA (adenosine(37)-N6)-threonylcarbamoyltransferase complex transferase subunit TsaD [Geobacter sp. DSM 9736]|uniref:tRNA (adenosine(37)-N6)-threonylcarbamoyltransferase complex transferase subunit TsaD n=1 Tax=Geobacter sp. DSM 9736 TaxID=1277350 RepID=UPI000B51435D|nr:tRNA (adenosine(37)-N6)-threonylcarbamoyltransferase complex transferase subunit TsaD [Geobacter sp. DSM 9736]SNB45888.1 O-sialoglycoprotein endopeptidase [Geobacter sp. DSM 9736]